MKYFFSIIAALFLLLSGCSGGERVLLERADAVMEENPDSALKILRDLDRDQLNNNDLPYFALLMTQAQVKTDTPLDSDSLISIAYAKYADDRSGDKGIRSNFYTGEVFFNQEKLRDAMRYYLTTYEEAKRLHDDYWRAKAAERISDLYFFSYNYDEAAKYSNEAVDLFKQVDRHVNHLYCLGQLARIYVLNGNADKAYIMLDSLKNLTLNQHPVDSAFLDYIKFPMINAMVQTGRIKNAKIGSTVFISGDRSDQEILDAAILQSEVNNSLNSPLISKDILKDVCLLAHSDEDKVHILYARYENAKACGDISLAISLVDSMLYFYSEVTEDIIKESVTGAQRDFYSDMSVRNERKSIRFRNQLWLAIGVFVLLVAGLIALHHFKSNAQQARLDANLESILSLRAQSDAILREKEAMMKERDCQDV